MDAFVRTLAELADAETPVEAEAEAGAGAEAADAAAFPALRALLAALPAADKPAPPLATAVLPQLTPRALLLLAHYVLSDTRSGALPEPAHALVAWLPELLAAVARIASISVAGHGAGAAGRAFSGAGYRDFLLGKLLAASWPRALVVRIASVFREVDLSPEQLAFVVDKILRHLREVVIQDLPLLVYQLLLLSAKVSN